MVIDGQDRFIKRQATVEAQRSGNAKRALMFLANKSPELREALTDLAKQEVARRHGTKT